MRHVKPRKGDEVNTRVELLKELVGDGLYVVDYVAVADAVLLRAMTRRMLPEVTFRGTVRPEPAVRPFRPYRGVRSFRLTGSERPAPGDSGASPATA